MERTAGTSPLAWTLRLALVAWLACCGGDDDNHIARPEVVTAGVEFGTTCDVDDDCGDVAAGAECCTGGKCSPDGWCSPNCDSDQDCPDGFYCIDHDGRRCFVECADDRDCPLDWQCEEKNDHFTCRYKD